MILGLLVGLMLSPTRNIEYSNSPIRQSNSLKLNNALKIINENYVDILDSDTLVGLMLNSTLYELDPHSRYLTREEMEKESESLQGKFDGIGIMLKVTDDTTRVDIVFANGPSAGLLQAGDKIVSVDGEVVAGKGLSSDEIVSKIRGPKRTNVDLGIKRYGEEGTRHVTVTRDVIQTNSISYSGIIRPNVGYIHLTRFSETSYSEFRKALYELQSQGMKDLVLDLRDNGGGIMSAATKIVDEFLPGEELIVYTQGAHSTREEWHSHPGGMFSKGRLVILINENSASASEIVSGAIQDNDRGIIVGRRSFGKGLVQQQFMMGDGSAMWLTTARYYTPSGRCIQRPYEQGSDEYYLESIKHIMYDMMEDTCLTYINDSTPYYTAKGRIVYGGGGIYPDYPLPFRKDKNLAYYNKLLGEGILGDYAFDYVTKNWKTLRSRYATAEQYAKEFQISDAVWNGLLAYGEKKGAKKDAKSLAAYGQEIRLRLKAEIGASLYDMDTFYKIMLPTDREINQAIEYLLKQPTK